MRKHIGISILVLALALTLALFAGCKKAEEPELPSCETCTFGEWVTVAEPTCAVEGKQERTCSVCGNTEENYLPKVDHKWGEWQITKSPSVEKEGEEARSCTVCGAAETKVIAKLIEVADMAALEQCLKNEDSSILLTADIALTKTLHITNETTFYIKENRTLTRSPDFLGDLFVIGETEGGMNVLLLSKRATLSIKTENGATLTIDGNKANVKGDVKGTAFYMTNSSEMNIHDGVILKNFKKVANERSYDEDSFSRPMELGGSVIIVESGLLNIWGGTFEDNEISIKNSDNTAEADRVDGYNESTWGGAIFNRSNLYIYDGVFKNNSAARGGVVCNYAHMHVYGGTFEDNYASTYGAVLYQPGSEYVASFWGDRVTDDSETVKITVKNNTSERSGGALFNSHQSSLLIYGNTEFDGNESTNGNGGAINSAGELTVKYASFKNNKSTSKGGAVYMYYSSTSNKAREYLIEDGIFEGNSAPRGGALCVYTADEVKSGVAKLTLGDVTFKQNNAYVTVDAAGKESNGRGGALYLSGGSKVYINGAAQFIGNTSEDNGGAVYMSTAAKLEISGGDDAHVLFDGNTSGDNGGALYAYTDTSVSLKNISFANNISNSEKYGGGAIFVSGGASLSMGGGMRFVTNTSAYNGGAIFASGASVLDVAEDSDIRFISNSSAKNGGAVFLTSGASMKLPGEAADTPVNVILSENDVVEVNTSVMFVNNTAATSGGGAFMYSSAYFEASGATFVRNTATNENGGALYFSKEADTDTKTFEPSNGVLDACIISENTSGKNGGAMSVYRGSTVTLKNTVTFSENTCNGNEANEADGGGAIYLNGAETKLLGSADDSAKLVLTNNTVPNVYGGALCASGAKIDVDTVEANGNKATVGYGGALYLSKADTTIKTLTSNQNTSGNNGGAVYMAKSAKLIAETLTANENVSTDGKGGSVYSTASTLTVGTLTANYNHADKIAQEPDPEDPDAIITTLVGEGGALYLTSGSDVDITTLTVNNNSAANQGGAIKIASAATDVNIGTISADTNTSTVGGAVYMEKATLTLGTSRFTNNSATAAGGAIYLRTDTPTLNITTSAYMSGNTASGTKYEDETVYGGGAIYVDEAQISAADATLEFVQNESAGNHGGAMSLIDSSLVAKEIKANQNTAKNNGGAIYMRTAATLTVNTLTANENTATDRGGAIYVTSNGTVADIGSLTMNGNSVTKYEGGAMYVTSQATVEVDDLTASENSSVDGGAIGVKNTGAKLTVNKTAVFADNTATELGGALYVFESASAVFADTVTDVRFIGNEAGTNGGAIAVNTAGAVELSGKASAENTNITLGDNDTVSVGTTVMFVNNKANTSGGAVYTYTGASFSAKGTTFARNNAEDKGGALYFSKEEDTTDTTFAPSSGVLDACVVKDNAAKTNGGAMAVYHGSSVTIKNTVTFSDNTATTQGGAIYTNASTIKGLAADNAHLVLTDNTAANDNGGAVYSTKSTVAVDKLTANGNTAPKKYGGALYLTGSDVDVTTLNATGNSSKSLGGLMYITSQATVDIGTLNATDNKCTDTGDTVGGGAIGIKYAGTTLTVGTATLNNNEAIIGGAMYILDGAEAKFTTLNASGNKATNGGAAYIVGEDSTLTVTGVATLNNNEATGLGGALYVFDSAKAVFADTATDVRFIGNKAGTNGGAIALDNAASAEFNGKSLSQNVNITLGDNDTVSVGTTVMFVNNTAATSGGAVYAYTGASFSAKGATFARNTAQGGNGGALYFSKKADVEADPANNVSAVIYQPSSGVLDACVIKDNTAESSGGAMAVYRGSSVAIKNTVTFSGNTATTGQGGAIYINASGSAIKGLAADNAHLVLTGNKASENNGGALYSTGATIAVATVTANDNESVTGQGGALYLTSGSDVDITTLTVNNNTAAGDGGAIKIASPATDVNIGTLSADGNKSDGNGGAIYIEKGKLTVGTATLNNNEATNGGALNIVTGATVTVTTLNASGNKATDGGAAYVNGSSLTVTGTATLNENVASGSGGALRILGGATVNISTLNGSQNEADKGGVAYVGATDDASATTLTVGTATLNNNNALGEGAALYIRYAKASATFTTLTISGNESVGNGGAIYVNTSATLNVGTLTAENNSTTGSYGGGAIYVSGGSSMTLDSVSASGNSAKLNTASDNAAHGGFMYANSANTTVTIKSGSISGNTAGGKGASIYGANKGVIMYIEQDVATPICAADDIKGVTNFAVKDYVAE